MRNEEIPNPEIESNNLDKVENQSKFPIVDLKETYYFDYAPETKKDKIVHYMERIGSSNEEKLVNKFILAMQVGRFDYKFNISQLTFYGKSTYGLSFSTEQYEYATVSLNEDERNALLIILPKFIESVDEYLNNEIGEILVSPAGAPYSANEIEECINEILASKTNALTRDELYKKHNGFRIFDYYRELFEKDFLPEYYNRNSRAQGRSRLFKMLVKKHLPNWKIKRGEEDRSFSPNIDFLIVRKNTNLDEEN